MRRIPSLDTQPSRIQTRLRERRKSFLPTLGLTVLLWIALFLTIIFLDPGEAISLPIFLLFVFTSIFFTAGLVLGGKTIGAVIATTVTLFFALRYFGLTTVSLVLLATGTILISVGLFWKRR